MEYREILMTCVRISQAKEFGLIGDRDVFLNQSSADFVFMLHLFSFGLFSGEFRADLLRLLFSILQWCQAITDSKLLAKIKHFCLGAFDRSENSSEAF